MVLALDGLWLGVLILVLAIFCTAPWMSVRVFWALILAVIVVGLALTIVSTVSKKGRAKTRVTSDEARLLEYLKSQGIKGGLSELAEGLGIASEEALRLLKSLEERGAIPAGSVKVLTANQSDVSTT